MISVVLYMQELKYHKMNKKYSFLTFILLFNTILVYGQLIRLPSDVNGKVAIVDENNVQTLSELYNDAIFYNEFQVMLLMNEEFWWGVYHFDGRMIIDHIIKSQRVGINYNNPIVKKVTKAHGRPFIVENDALLLQIDANFDDKRFYFNPNNIQKTYKAYQIEKLNMNESELSISSIHKNRQRYYPSLIKVYNDPNSINFIDTNGIETLKINAKSGAIINEDFTFVSQGNSYAVVDNKSGFPITDFKFSDLRSMRNDSILILEEKYLNNNKERTKFHLYTCFNKFKLIDSADVYGRINENILVHKDDEVLLYNIKGDKLKSISKNDYYLSLGSNIYVVKKTDDQNYEFSSLKGDIIYKDIYSVNKLGDQHISLINQFNETTIINDKAEVVFVVKDVDVMMKLKNKPYFIVMKDIGNSYHYSIINTKNETIIDQNYNMIDTTSFENLIICKDVDSISIFDLNKNKAIVTKSNSWNLDYKYKKRFIFSNDVQEDIYDQEGNLLSNRLLNIKTKYKYKKEKSGEQLVDSQNNPVINKIFKTIRYSRFKNETLYICTLGDETYIYNDSLKQLLPENWVIRWNMMDRIGSLGLLVIYNLKDREGFSMNHKLGVMKLDGEWLVKPFNGRFITEHEIISLWNNDEQKNIIITTNGVLDHNDNIVRIFDQYVKNRAMVTICTDKEYMKKVRAINPRNMTFSDSLLINDAQNKIKFGYINKYGDIVIQPKYYAATSFDSKTFHAIVSSYDNGKPKTQIIDTSENVIFDTDFETLKIINYDKFIVSANKKFGIITKSHETKIPLDYSKIEEIKGSEILLAYINDEAYLIDSLYRILSIGPVKFENVIRSGEYLIVIHNKLDKKIGLIFNGNYDLIHTLTRFNSISTLYNSQPLTEGFINIYDIDKRENRIFDINKKKFLESMK